MRIQKAKSLHRVTPKEKFLICELEKAREFPWNDVERLKHIRIKDSSGHLAYASDDQDRYEDWSNTWMQRL